jgi:dolichol-phosphate mannosyltransferase
MDLTLLIAAVDEAENLRRLVPELKRRLDAEGMRYEILVVDGDSSDGTPETARGLGCRVERQSGPGYAQAIRDGIRLARGRHLVVMDADGSHHPDDVLTLYRQRHRADIVINSRYVPGASSETIVWRSALSRLLNACYRWVLRLPYREISGGFRIYRREILLRFELESRFYEIQEELLIKPHWLGYRAVEIPYTYRERVHGASKARVLRYGVHLLWALVRFRRSREAFLRAHASSARPPSDGRRPEDRGR